VLLAAAFSLGAMSRLVGIPAVAIAPDDSRIAFVTQRAVLDRNAYADDLRVYDLRSRTTRVIGGPSGGISTLRWSPDGAALAFIADDDATTQAQLFYLDVKTGRIRRLTSGGSDVDDFAWRPDGRGFAIVRRDVATVRHGAASYEDAFAVTDEAYLTTSAPQPRHLWTVDLIGNAKRLAHPSWSAGDASPSWSPDGRSLLYLRVPDGVRASQSRAVVERLDLATGISTPLTTHARLEDQPLYSPDGTQVLYRYSRDGVAANTTDAMLVGANGAGDRDLSAPLDRHVDTAAWMPLGCTALLKVYDATAGPLYRQPCDGSAVAVPLGDVVDAAIDTEGNVARDGALAFAGTQVHRPVELYYLAPGANAPVRITDLNASAAALDLGHVTSVSWQHDGFDERGVLTYPPDFDRIRAHDPAHRFPLVLRIHGGPTETSEAMFDPFYQLAAAHGYLVFSPNYRGSSNLGNRFEHAIFDDASAGPGGDIEAGIRAVEALGIVDETRLAVSGWSYGGQLTSWMIGHYQIWKCAVTGAAVNDLVVDYAIADDIDAARDSFSQPPFAGDALPAWQAQSPITYYKDIRTPLLLMGNVYDVRVPIVEQYEMYHALRDRGVPAELYVYPSGGHLPRGPVRLADAYRRWLAWFDRYLH
jgi:dipeptidyl aminopeptidase/acylaminoacyl peptidase